MDQSSSGIKNWGPLFNDEWRESRVAVAGEKWWEEQRQRRNSRSESTVSGCGEKTG